METSEKFLRGCILGAIGAALMSAGDWLLGCIPLQQTDTGLFIICPALMGCGGPCLPLDWERLGAFSITLR